MSNGRITDQAEPHVIKIAIRPFSPAIQGTKKPPVSMLPACAASVLSAI